VRPKSNFFFEAELNGWTFSRFEKQRNEKPLIAVNNPHDGLHVFAEPVFTFGGRKSAGPR
jgi:hypothetical protein